MLVSIKVHGRGGREGEARERETERQSAHFIRNTPLPTHLLLGKFLDRYPGITGPRNKQKVW